jgi:phosphatidylserine/phosphatidylglycerophosphate/cardiolipin synthase-like enzyme
MKYGLKLLVALSSVSLSCSLITRALGPPDAASASSDATLAAPGPAFPTTQALVPIPIHAGVGVAGPWYDLYFTDPASPASRQFSGGLDDPLVGSIDHARLSVHVAMYSLTLNSITTALIRAHDRGVDVQVVMESDNLDEEDPQRLKEAQIPLLGDRRRGLMHDKFMIVDQGEVWTGSMNFTNSGTYEDNNVLIHVRSVDVAEDYEAEFKEMFEEDRFGPAAGNPTPKPLVQIGASEVEVSFSPDDGVEARLVQLLESASSSIHFLAFSFTADDLSRAVLDARKLGVQIAGVMDADQADSNLGTEWPTFRDAGLDVRLDGNPGQMHEKVIIVDSSIVVVGSYNFTASAAKSNDENILIIHDPVIAQQFENEFGRVFAAAQH